MPRFRLNRGLFFVFREKYVVGHHGLKDIDGIVRMAL